ncbi:hypothetical protein D3C77_529360 [compost metagenome]
MSTVRMSFTQGSQRIRRFAGLADDDYKRLRCDQRRAITVFRSDIILHWNANELLNCRAAHKPSIKCRTTGHDVNAVQAAYFFRCQLQFGKYNLTSAFVDPPSHRVTISLRLLVNFLQHEMIEAAFFCGHCIPIDRNHFPRNKVPLNGHQFDSIFGQNRHLTVIQNIYFSRIIQNGRNV